MSNKICFSLIIVNPTRIFSFRVFQYIFFISIIVFFITLILTDYKLVYITLGAVSFISGIFVSYLREHNIKGFIKIDINQIVIKESFKKEKVYNISSLNKIIIIYREYKDAPFLFNPQSIGLKKGLNNYIKIYSKKDCQCFEVLLQKNDLVKINKIANLWRKQGVNIILINKWGKEVNQFYLF